MTQLIETLDVSIHQCPFHYEVNQSIEKFIDELPLENSSRTVESQNMVRWIYNSKVKTFDPAVGRVVEWITRLINSEHQVPFSTESILNLKCVELWAVKYNENSFLESHFHSGYNYTFSYNVSVPQKSSSLVFTTSGYEIKSKPGDLVVFDSKLKHHVPPNNVGGRCVLVGNYVYEWL